MQIGLGTSVTNSSTLQLDYGYGSTTNNGNVMTQTITIGAGTPTPTTISQSYTYDALNRLATASENGGTVWSQTYGYDRYGNRWVSASPGYTLSSLTPTLSNHISATNNRLVMGPSHYDAAGNLDTDAKSRTFTYDAENRQTSFNGTVGQYFYDGDGRRVKKTEPNNNVTVFVYNAGGQLIAEYHSDPVPPAAGGGGTSYLTTDHLGSTRVVTKQDGTVKARCDYLPFGEELGSGIGGRTVGMGYSGADSTRQKFTQKERDAESGLDYFLARYYSSAQGRFTSPDEFAGGPDEFWILGSGDSEKQALPYANTTNPQSLNKYHYCFNNPLRYVDPDGHQESAQQAMDRNVKDLAEGRISEDEYWARQRGGALGVGVGLAAVAVAVGGPKLGLAILGWVFRNPEKAQQVAQEMVQASNGNPAPINQMALAKQIPKLTGGTGRQMLGEALSALKSSKGNAAQKADLFEALGKQITQQTKGTWEAARSAGTDGSHIFAGGQGELLVINSKGQLFRGRIQDGGVAFGKGGTFTPNYEKLKEVK